MIELAVITVTAIESDIMIESLTDPVPDNCKVMLSEMADASDRA